mmetsp:Transcript_14161/g.17894  ORF Transcript_14161/g.17894 Transcript_14161/m.17894 type:complete len:217 (-) Transcript_14161:271-921(-)
MCFTQCTTYSASVSVNGSGSDDWNTRPKAANSGILLIASGPTDEDSPLNDADGPTTDSNRPDWSFDDSPPSAFESSTTGKSANVIASSLSIAPGVSMYDFKRRSKLSNVHGNLCMSKNTAGSSSFLSSAVSPSSTSPPSSPSSNDEEGTKGHFSSASSKIAIAKITRSLVSSLSSKRHDLNNFKIENRNEGHPAPNFPNAATEAARIFAFSNIHLL